MVSMVETASHPGHNDTVMDSVVPKSEPLPDGSISSTVSTPDAEAEPLTQDTTQTQKRKGGRKPIYATSEERKQRNRQAQAAFRERRTEYIRQLETTIKRNEESLQSLQQSHRSAADECLMLRYKNSLLERILLEKGIDVQAELRLKTGAPGSSAKPNPVPAKSGPIPRPTQRHPAGIASKPDAFAISQRDGAYAVPSPQFQATPTSHVSSPSHAKSPGYGFQAGMSPVEVNAQGGGRPQLLPQPRTFTSQTSPGAISMPQTDPTEKSRGPRGARVAAAYYPSPFQKHYDQLEQEYDAQADLVDDDHDGSVNASYVPGFTPQSVASGSHNMTGYNPSQEGAPGDYGNANQLMAQYEPMLDADPFGLSASMHFPTPFNYDQNNPRS
ncbi:bZIP transcription factor [Penicillium brasilianum]|uniref:BZIP transcription factor n=1 Tax=Penicillium brasilianum TaxID=104259 RepID=A0A1S9R801_PENBI|nr:bZIP transcription factor [Penicillium brasilianum]